MTPKLTHKPLKAPDRDFHKTPPAGGLRAKPPSSQIAGLLLGQMHIFRAADELQGNPDASFSDEDTSSRRPTLFERMAAARSAKRP